MLEVQRYLLTRSLEQLAKEHGVYARWSKDNHKKFTLNYDQIEAKDGNPIVEECRGLVLEILPVEKLPNCEDGYEIIGPTRILAYPFRRFYNHGQGAAENIDWDTATFFEKLDGTLCIVYFDDTLGVWSVATRSVPDADIPYENVTGKTFSQLFKQAIESDYNFWDDFTDGLNKDLTYLFELCTPENIVVVQHKDYKAWLLGARNRETLIEEDVLSKKYTNNFRVCPHHELNYATIHKFVTSRNPIEYEGVVVRDGNFNRIKVKDPAYAFNSKIKDKAVKSPRALLELILMGKDDDVRPLLQSNFLEALDKHKDNLRLWLLSQDIQFRLISKLAGRTRKDFAVACQQVGAHIPVQMFIYDMKGTPLDWVRGFQNEDGSFPNGFLDNLSALISKKY